MFRLLGGYGRNVQASKTATRQQPYRIPSRIHSVRVKGMSGLHGIGAEYFGPPREGQTWSQFNEYMNAQNVAIGGAIATLAIINPIIGLGAAAMWVMGGGPQKKTNKEKAGGY